MKTISIGWVGLGALVMLGCGGGQKSKQPTMARSETRAAAPATTPDRAEPMPASTAEPGLASEPASLAEPTPTDAAPMPGGLALEDKNELPKAAVRLLVPGATDIIGTVSFEQEGTQVRMVGTFAGLKPGFHGVQLRENGLCTGKGAKDSGKHFNPGKSKHGPVGSATRHLGDLGNIEADKEGNAMFSLVTDSVTVTPGVDSIVGRSFVITANKDNGKSQPDGNAGPGVACGVIMPGALSDLP